MMLKEKSHDFVEWREEFVSRERGSRVVQYYLEDSSGESHLAVVGTERSLRHMFYAIAEFCHEYGADSCLKWRSKREVVDWLSSFISPRQGSQKNDSLPKTGADITADRVTSPGTCLHKPLNQPSRNLRSHKSDITWTGDSWTCGKLLRHYKALCRNGTMITIYHCGQPTKQETSVLLFRYIGEESVERCRLVMGPFKIIDDFAPRRPVKLLSNPFSWTKVASIIYVDSPAGTGYSYADSVDDYITSDTKTVADLYEFILKFFSEYPEFLPNPLYVGACSYSGAMVPPLAQEMVNETLQGRVIEDQAEIS